MTQSDSMPFPSARETVKRQWFNNETRPERSARRFVRMLLALVYPMRCLATGRALPLDSSVALSEDGFDSLPWIDGAFCHRCGAPSAPGLGEQDRCASCRDLTLVFRRAISVWRYEPPVSDVIKALKFKGRLSAINVLAVPLAERIRAVGLDATVDAVCPVPVRPASLKSRGFNPALEIARVVARHLNKPFLPNLLTKTRNTAPQATLPRPKRISNLKDAFVAETSASGLRVLTIDDVMTTGATLTECSRALLAAGAKSVFVATAARTEA
ncbi:MAG: ComF family protein [Planctomycetota bacterium]